MQGAHQGGSKSRGNLLRGHLEAKSGKAFSLLMALKQVIFKGSPTVSFNETSGFSRKLRNSLIQLI